MMKLLLCELYINDLVNEGYEFEYTDDAINDGKIIRVSKNEAHAETFVEMKYTFDDFIMKQILRKLVNMVTKELNKSL